MIIAAKGTQLADDTEATFLDLYDRESALVLRYARSAIGDGDAEDVCADTFCSAWLAWPKFRGNVAAERAWIMRIARNKVIDRGRANRRADLAVLRDEAAAAGESDVVERLELRAALTRLSRSDRELLELRSAGLTHAEIGAIQGRGEVAVKVAWHRALQRLRPHLEVNG
jgi:RNA polymerase sigma-70 factor (ECF subfamily)